MPLYVTRKDSDGLTATWSVSAYAGVAMLVLFQLNALVWGVVGLITAVRVLF